MKCGTDFFYNENVGSCFSCSDICDNLIGTGNSMKNCRKHCPDYKSNAGLTKESDTGSHYLEIILPIIFISVFLIIIATFLIKRRLKQGRNKCQQNLPVDTPTPPLKYTEEEVGDDNEVLESLSDSGIDTTRIDLSAHESRPQTGLSEMPANAGYLRNASDASRAQETLV